MKSHPVDLYVGARLRERRTLLGISQEELGNFVGITFQQIQKYERGHNRIGSSRLYDFARILETDVSYFFEGYKGESSASGKLAGKPKKKPRSKFRVLEFEKNNKEALALIRSYYSIPDLLVRKKILSLIKSLGQKELIGDTNETDGAEDAEQIDAPELVQA